MDINNYYNFKNPIRHFMDIKSIECPFNIKDIGQDRIDYTVPIGFRIRKLCNSSRMLKMPNILNFICAYNKFKDYEHLDNPNLMHLCKRLVPNLETGDFKTGEFDLQLESDFQQLVIYDKLMKLDIKSYYGRIYTHHIEFENKNRQENDEKYLTNLNMGNTNGLIMGNYLSLYFAEKYLVKIINDLEESFNKEKINCQFSHFSDDFYFFCFERDKSRIIRVFESVLENYELEINTKKKEEWSYLDYNEHNKIERYWKKIISECKFRFDESKVDNKLYFINQLIYRISKLKDEQSKKIFILGFFKSEYFQNIDINKYKLEDYNKHQLCYIYKFCPEAIIYSIGHFRNYDYFKEEKFGDYLKVRYESSLSEPYNEEQLYYYFAIKLLNFNSILNKYTYQVYESKNQILISYYLKDGLFDEYIINDMKGKVEERYWFQNYHLILYTDLKYDLENSIKKYLIPKSAEWDPKNEARRKRTHEIKHNTYLEFYKFNLKSNNSIIKNIEVVYESINKYIYLKLEERNNLYGNEVDCSEE